MLLPFDAADLLLDVCKREFKTFVYTKIGTQIFIAALFVTTKKQKKPKDQLFDRGLTKCNAFIQ